jgi:hypothetical protein
VIFKNPILVNNHSSQKTRTEGSLVFNFSKNWNQRLQLNFKKSTAQVPTLGLTQNMLHPESLESGG